MKFTIQECADDHPQVTDDVTVKCEKDDLCLMIGVKGYGEHCSADGQGHPVLLERFQGKLRLVIWADINQEDPTHIIELEGAREDRRIADNCETVTQHKVDKYCATNGVSCPWCGSDDLTCGNWDTQDHAVFREVECGCGRRWTDEYKLT